jgi:acetyl esterase/lipase
MVRIRTLSAAVSIAALAGAVLAGPSAASTPRAGSTTRTAQATTGLGAATSAVGAIVGVAINTLGLLTHYVVQFGSTTTYGSSTPAKIASGTSGTAHYQVTLDHLVPSTVYHYRVAATSLFGATTYGHDETFATWPVQIPFDRPGVVSPNNLISRPSGRKPKGWMVVIHGGGWQSVGREDVASEDSTVAFLNRQGWATDNIDYRKGEHSLPDVLAAYDGLRKRVGSRVPICLMGESAGGNLALLTAEQRQSVSCVVSMAGPTDLVRFTDEKAHRYTSRLWAVYTPAWAFEQYMVTSFGISTKVLREWSPIMHAGALDVPVLLGASSYDPVVPQHQMAELRDAMAAQHATGPIKTALLAGKNTPTGKAPNFTHASVTHTALNEWHADVRQLLTRIASAA